MNTRRPSTPKDAGSPRMSFASAEALLWGPEMKKQHAYLLTEMRTLQKQHESYDTRIQATETIADAAETATTRLRHLEQKVAAMEAEDEDKAFEKWASGELARLNVFVDANKSVRQKQVELCTEVLRVTEDIDMLKGVPTDLKDVLRHLELLERGRREDALKIERLEREVTRLGNDKEVEERIGKERSGARSRQNRARLAVSPLGLVGDYSNSYSKPGRRTATPPRTLAADTSDSTTEPDDELMRLPRPCPTFSREQVQVPQSPANQMKEYASIDLTSPTKDRPIISARRKLFQRPSIHESRLPRLVGEEIQHSLPAYTPCIRPRNSPPAETQLIDRILQAVAPPLVRESHIVPTDNLPTTQLVNRAMPRKRKQPESIPPSQRQTRSQAKKSRDMEVKDEQQQASEGTTIQIQPAQLLGTRTSPRKKLKTSTSPGATKSKARSNQTTQGASKTRRRPKKENTDGTSSEKQSVRRTQPATAGLRKSTRAKAAAPVQTTAPIPAPRRPVSPTKPKRLIVTLSIPHMMAHSDLDGSESIQVSAADRVKIAHRKAADGKLAPFKAKPKPLSARSKNLQAISPAGRGENDLEPLLDPADELLFA